MTDLPLSPMELRVLVLAPTAKDAEVTRSVLESAGLPCLICHTLAGLTREVKAGAAAVLLTQEAVASDEIVLLIHALSQQESWSDLPVIILMRGGVQSPVATQAIFSLGNVTLLERPALTRSVVSAAQSAVRSRKRQYQMREQFAEILRAEAKYKQLRQQLEIALDASELGTFHCEIPLGKVVWNDRCKAHFWLPPEAEIDIDLFYSILHPDDRDATRRAVEDCVNKGAAYDVQYRTVSPLGEIRWVRATGRTYFDELKNPIRFDGTTQDVTHQRQAAQEREQLLESERAARAESERAGRIKDEFLATLSHELRTPLNAILGWSQLIRASDDKQMLGEGLDVIERNARVQVQLIEDLLDMSRIISGKIRLEVRPVMPESFIAAAIDTVNPAAEAKGIRLHSLLDSHAGPVSGDHNRLQQVIWNLLANAIKFTPKGGQVRVVLERVDSRVEISVCDNGQGIKPEFLPYVFERFRQADASITRSHGGLGLGLAIVKQLTELHGGTVRAESAGPGHGSTFVVALPLAVLSRERLQKNPPPASEAAQRQASRAYCSTSLRGTKVLVVDDERDAQRLVKRVLEECEAEVITAGSAAEGLALIESARPDVLVSDIGMPGMDGYEFLQQVRALGADRGGKIPAIALTAFARSEDRTRALLAGFLVHVSKPVEPQELIATVASVAGRTGELTSAT